MHPARSVIFFTTASGAGYGLLAILGVAAALGRLPVDLWLGLVSMGLALGLISAGLLASLGHLGHPERAWRAFSQWRSSWLSREGVASIVTYVPAGLFGIGWVFFGRTDGWAGVAGAVAAASAAVTVGMTGMIYASLTPVAEWHTRYTLPGYFIYALTTGLTLFNAIVMAFGLGTITPLALALLATLVSWGWKQATWRYNDHLVHLPTANAATGLAGGTVRSVEWPHTDRNYLLKEMGYRIARKHRGRLRALTQLFAFVFPSALLIVALAASGWPAVAASLIAAPVQLAGMLIERWLFFADATHIVTLYYGREQIPTAE